MSQIDAGPLQYDFGKEFNYFLWDENTELMLTNVPWNTDYRDIVVFETEQARTAWFDRTPNVRLRNASMQKFNSGVVKIDLPMNEAMRFNYLRARNGPSPVSGVSRDYFYFITGVQWGAANTTYLSLQVDVIQTFFPEVSFGNSYVERGHIGIANTKQMDGFGRDYLTVPEGLDLGGEYRTVHAEFERVMGQQTDDSGYDVLVCSTLDLTQPPYDADGNPGIKSAVGSLFQGVPSGASFYLFKGGADLNNFFQVFTDKPWITQSIISITLIPNMTRYIPNFDYGDDLYPDNPLAKLFWAGVKKSPEPRLNTMAPNWRESDFLTNALGPEYAILKKFLTYPYLVLELTTFTGSPLIIKPESWQDANAAVVEIAAMLPPAQRVGIMPLRYNADFAQSGDKAFEYDYGESIDFVTWLDDFPQVPIVNNSAAAFLANNRNGLAFSFASADWTQQRALAAAQASYDVQNAQIGNTGRQSGIANTRDTEVSNLMGTTQVTNSIIGAAGSVPDMAMSAAGAMRGAGRALEGGRRSAGASGGQLAGAGMMDAAGGIGGAAAGMLQAGMSAQASMQAAQIANTARGESAISDIQTAGSIRDTNNAFATMAAKGDYANAIAGIQAKIQDARMLQPSIGGQFGGSAFNLINNFFGYSLRWKMPNKNALKQLGQYWLRYGYAINQFIVMPDSLHCMTKFTYWKLSETYISQGNFPEGFKQIIRGIFEKGVTVWKNPDDIGHTSLADNQPLGGISY